MQDYRRYEIDAQGRILKGEWFQAANDQDALDCSRPGPGEGVVEVWQQARRVGRVDRRARP